jgi:hypothetical protein
MKLPWYMRYSKDHKSIVIPWYAVVYLGVKYRVIEWLYGWHE